MTWHKRGVCRKCKRNAWVTQGLVCSVCLRPKPEPPEPVTFRKGGKAADIWTIGLFYLTLAFLAFFLVLQILSLFGLTKE